VQKKKKKKDIRFLSWHTALIMFSSKPASFCPLISNINHIYIFPQNIIALPLSSVLAVVMKADFIVGAPALEKLRQLLFFFFLKKLDVVVAQKCKYCR